MTISLTEPKPSAAMLRDLLQQNADDVPVLLCPDGRELTAAEALDAFETVRTATEAAGIKCGDRVAVLASPHLSTAILLLALFDQITVLLFNPDAVQSATADALRSASADYLMAPSGVLDPWPEGTRAGWQETGGLRLLETNLCIHRLREQRADDTTMLRDPGLVLHTSGTTGTPKRVPLRSGQLISSARNIARHLNLSANDRAVHCLPMFHVGAIVDLLLAPLLAGGSVIVTGDSAPRKLEAAVLGHGATWLQLVPTMLNRCLADLPAETSARMGDQLRFVRMVSSDLQEPLRHRAETAFAGTPLIQMYGMTETAGQITSNPLVSGDRPAHSVGIVSGPEVRIIDQQGAVVAVGREGEVCVAGETVTTGYEGSDSTPRHGRWFRSGDLGRFDAAGHLFLTGRLKEMINRGGEKISPVVVERAAMKIEGVSEAAAHALAHPTLGEQVGLAVVTDPATDPGEDHILTRLRADLSEFELPRRITFLAELPRLPSGKIDRRALAASSTVQSDDSSVRSGTALIVSKVWQKVLSVRPPYDDADFFDDGGDSLAATEFILQLEKSLNRSLAPNLLFEAPRFGALVERIDSQPARPTAKEPKYLEFVRLRTAGWAGQRAGSRDLVVARNTISDRIPVILGVNGIDIADVFGAVVLDEHPTFLLRSLDGYKGRNAAMRAQLAKVYAEELAEITDGPVICAGFCSGAALMEDVADTLREMGRSVMLFISIDHRFVRPTPYPVFHICSETDRFSPFARFYEPQRAFGYWHPAGCEVVQIAGNHLEAMTEANFRAIAPEVKPYLDGATLSLPKPQPPVDQKERQPLYKARIRAVAPRRWRHGQSNRITVHVQNKSAHDWLPTGSSGLRIVAEFRNFDGIVRKVKAGTAPVLHTVGPGDVFSTEIDLHYPDTDLPLLLRVSMIDDGYGYFDEFGSRGFSKVVWAWPRRST